MNKAQCVAKYAKLLKRDYLKSLLLTACVGGICGLIYRSGESAGAHATYKELAEICPEDSFIIEDEKASKDTN